MLSTPFTSNQNSFTQLQTIFITLNSLWTMIHLPSWNLTLPASSQGNYLQYSPAYGAVIWLLILKQCEIASNLLKKAFSLAYSIRNRAGSFSSPVWYSLRSSIEMKVGKPLLMPRQMKVMSRPFPPFSRFSSFFNLFSPFTVSSPSEMNRMVIEASAITSSSLSSSSLRAPAILVMPPPCFLRSSSRQGDSSSLACWLNVMRKWACSAMDWFQNLAMSFQKEPMLPEASMRPTTTLFLAGGPSSIFSGRTGILNSRQGLQNSSCMRLDILGGQQQISTLTLFFYQYSTTNSFTFNTPFHCPSTQSSLPTYKRINIPYTQYRMPKGKRDKKKEIEDRRNMRKQDREAKKQTRKKMMSKGDKFKLSKEYVKYYEDFDRELKALDLKLRDVGGDGNCLFRSISDQVDGNETTHRFMREEACKYILANQEFFANFLDEDEDGNINQYVYQMRKPGEWGGHLELQALSECFRCIIVVHKRNLEEYYINPINVEPTAGLIHLAYFQDEDFQHYLSVRHVDDFSEEPASVRLKQTNQSNYQHLLYDDPEEFIMMKQIEELEIAGRFDEGGRNEQSGQEDGFSMPEEPYPNYPRNKKCKCGSKESYKNCCFKEYQKKISKMGL